MFILHGCNVCYHFRCCWVSWLNRSHQFQNRGLRGDCRWQFHRCGSSGGNGVTACFVAATVDLVPELSEQDKVVAQRIDLTQDSDAELCSATTAQSAPQLQSPTSSRDGGDVQRWPVLLIMIRLRACRMRCSLRWRLFQRTPRRMLARAVRGHAVA